MQDIYYKNSKLTVINIEVVKTIASFLAWCNFWNSGPSYDSYNR